MPCCCKSNLQAAWVLGIIFSIFNLLGCTRGDIQSIVAGIVFALINAFLIFGATQTQTEQMDSAIMLCIVVKCKFSLRNRIVLMVWIVLAFMEIGVYCVYLVLLVIALTALSVGSAGAFGSLFAILIVPIMVISHN